MFHQLNPSYPHPGANSSPAQAFPLKAPQPPINRAKPQQRPTRAFYKQYCATYLSNGGVGPTWRWEWAGKLDPPGRGKAKPRGGDPACEYPDTPRIASLCFSVRWNSENSDRSDRIPEIPGRGLLFFFRADWAWKWVKRMIWRKRPDTEAFCMFAD